mmetsp:Transcript_7900/g.11426  ORF Transcript_7900/g.11426 Transcript_7900/m.11426 type:complete len:85 (+) Transcript_7900:913-1167(+)
MHSNYIQPPYQEERSFPALRDESSVGQRDRSARYLHSDRKHKYRYSSCDDILHGCMYDAGTKIRADIPSYLAYIAASLRHVPYC